MVGLWTTTFFTGKNSIILQGALNPSYPNHSGKVIALKIFKRTFVHHKPPNWGTGICIIYYDWEAPTESHIPRKLVNSLAEREYHVLDKLSSLGLNCPKPFPLSPTLQRHVVLMSFIGENMMSPPKFKDLHLVDTKDSIYQQPAYNQVIIDKNNENKAKICKLYNLFVNVCFIRISDIWIVFFLDKRIDEDHVSTWKCGT